MTYLSIKFTIRKKKKKLGLVVLVLILALKRQRLGDLFEFETSLVYMVSSRAARTALKTVSNPLPPPCKKKIKNIADHQHSFLSAS